MKENNTVEKKVYSVAEVAKMLALSLNGAYTYIKNDPPFKVYKIGKSYRIQKESFDNWFNTI